MKKIAPVGDVDWGERGVEMIFIVWDYRCDAL